jgi:hypothetical protein
MKNAAPYACTRSPDRLALKKHAWSARYRSAMFPARVEKLIVMDAFLPGGGSGEAVYRRARFPKRMVKLTRLHMCTQATYGQVGPTSYPSYYQQEILLNLRIGS